MKRNAVFILLVLILLAPAQTIAALAVESYEELVSAIRQAKAQSRERIETLVEAEKVREAWEIGKLIDAHVFQHKERADYGKQVLGRLAKDLDTSQTELSLMLQFARAYPIYPQANKLSWSHYRELLSLNDSEEMEELAKQAAREGWGRDRVREEVRRRQASKKPGREREPAAEILTAAPGKPGTYRVVKAYYGKQPNQLVVDLGFSNYFHPPGKFPFKEGDIVRENKGELKKSKEAGEKDLFTYPAAVIKVIDGDTFTAAIELGFGFTTVQTLRLRALDAPEIESAEGREAKEFLEKKMPQGSGILIRTHRSDKYDRYLADVFVNGEYMNQKMVEQGLAVPVSNETGRV